MKKMIFCVAVVSTVLLLSGCAGGAFKPAAYTKAWYTCYARNQHRQGVWLSTSHHEMRAKTRAYQRCRRFSGKPLGCYFDYCRHW